MHAHCYALSFLCQILIHPLKWFAIISKEYFSRWQDKRRFVTLFLSRSFVYIFVNYDIILMEKAFDFLFAKSTRIDGKRKKRIENYMHCTTYIVELQSYSICDITTFHNLILFYGSTNYTMNDFVTCRAVRDAPIRSTRTFI